MAEKFYYFLPSTPPPADILKCHQLTYEFRQEIKYRNDFQEYCQWYYETSRIHQEEVKKMSNDINFFGWFLKSKK